jgi:hypothetical protein
MMTDTELRIKGLSILSKTMGSIEAERFITLIIREPLDYTDWQKDLWNDVSVSKLSKRAMQDIHKPQI